MTGNRKALFDLVTGPELGKGRFSATPLWLWDPASGRPVWANGAALRLWRAQDFAEFVERADPARQPGLSQLCKTAQSLAFASRRVERIRLYETGQSVNLTCGCAWLRAGPADYLSVTVLDRAAAAAPPQEDDPSDLPRRLLAGLDAPAFALGEDGKVLFANSTAGDMFFKNDGDGEEAAVPSGLAELAQHALAEGRCRGRVDHGDTGVTVTAVRVDPEGFGAPFVAVQPRDPAEADERDAAADAEPDPARSRGSGPAPRPAADEPGDEAAFTEVIFKPDWDQHSPAREKASGPAIAASEKAVESLDKQDNILPFHMAFSLGMSPPNPAQRSGLEIHERDAFKALARALGARMEGEEENEAEPNLAPASATGSSATSVGSDPDTVSDRPPASFGEQEVEAVLAHLPVGLLIYRHAVPLYANRAFLNLFGCANFAELENLGDVMDLLPKIKSEPGGTELRPDGDGEQPLTTLVAYDRAGHAIAVMARLQAVRWAGEPAILLSVRPAQAADESQPALPAPAEGLFTPLELANIVNLSSDGIVIIGEDGCIAALSDRAGALLRGRALDVVGRPFDSLFTGDSRTVVADYLDGLRYHGIAGVLGDGRKVQAKLPNGAELPLYLTMGELGADGARRFCALLRDLSQWTRAETELVRARIAAETATAHKSDLLARISHEMRTPLNSIIGFSEVMLEGRLDNMGSARYRDYVRDIHTSGTYLLGLVNDLLDLSKVEAGKLELNFTRLDVNELALQCVRLMLPEANQGRVIVRSSLARSLPAVVADHRSLRQILLNLLSNAVKFTLPGGQVVLSTSLSNEGEVQIRVRDTGVGMEEKDIALALEPFRQVAPPADPRKAGTGLGLPLTKALAEVNRARFRIESAIGEGTLTEITFPSQRVLAE